MGLSVGLLERPYNRAAGFPSNDLGENKKGALPFYGPNLKATALSFLQNSIGYTTVTLFEWVGTQNTNTRGSRTPHWGLAASVAWMGKLRLTVPQSSGLTPDFPALSPATCHPPPPAFGR